MTLRRRMMLAIVLLVTVGLAALDVLTLQQLHSYLYGRVDDQLATAAVQIDTYLQRADARGYRVTPATLAARVSPEDYVLVIGRDGRILVSKPSGTGPGADPAPLLAGVVPSVRQTGPGALPHDDDVDGVAGVTGVDGVAGAPADPDGPASATGATGATTATTRAPGSGVAGVVAGSSGRIGPYRPRAGDVDLPSVRRRGPEYRVELVNLPRGTLVVATRLDAVEATLSSLRTIELAVSGTVVLTLVLLIWLLMRSGLRPLEAMTSDADAIAGGDLGRRVRSGGGTGEIDRLGGALNAMLDQIEQAFSQRARSEERLREFLADASHELRTPLTSIRGYAELLRTGALPDETARQRALTRIEQEAARMGVLIGDLSVLAGEGTEPEPAVVRVDLAAIAADVVADARTVDPGRPVTLDAPEPVDVAGDLTRLAQLVHNLVRNALVHTPDGTAVEVSVGRRGDRAVLRVADHGPGMTPEVASRVFDRFYRAPVTGPDDATSGGGVEEPPSAPAGTAGAGPDAGGRAGSPAVGPVEGQVEGPTEGRAGGVRRTEGSGLGLFIVATLARRFGGVATVETAPGRGAVFEVVLPRWGAAPLEANADEGVASGTGGRVGGRTDDPGPVDLPGAPSDRRTGSEPTADLLTSRS